MIRLPPALARSLDAWLRSDVLRKSAALAFYTAFSLAPLLVIALWAGSLLVDAAALRQQLLMQLRDLFGPTTAEWIDGVLAQTRYEGGGLAAMAATALLLVGATTALAELKASLDEIFGRGDTPGGSISALVRSRAYALGLIFTLGFLLMVSLFVNATIAALASHGLGWLGIGPGTAARIAGEVTTLLATAALFAAIYAWLPARRIGLRAVLWATGLSAVCFTIGRLVISEVIANTDVTAYGAAGAFAVVLLWIYYSAVVFYSAAVVVAAALPASGSAERSPAPVSGEGPIMAGTASRLR